jgi:coenzyme F420-reducing hydrogenase delta subunit
MNVRPESVLHKVKVNVLTRVVTLIGDDGEEVDIQNNSANEFTKMCNFINESLTEDMIEYTY